MSRRGAEQRRSPGDVRPGIGREITAWTSSTSAGCGGSSGSADRHLARAPGPHGGVGRGHRELGWWAGTNRPTTPRRSGGRAPAAPTLTGSALRGKPAAGRSARRRGAARTVDRAARQLQRPRRPPRRAPGPVALAHRGRPATGHRRDGNAAVRGRRRSSWATARRRVPAAPAPSLLVTLDWHGRADTVAAQVGAVGSGGVGPVGPDLRTRMRSRTGANCGLSPRCRR
jgi:hypothetical protein